MNHERPRTHFGNDSITDLITLSAANWFLPCTCPNAHEFTLLPNFGRMLHTVHRVVANIAVLAI